MTDSRRIFDICEMGAVGDGKTDCTAVIQKAMDLAGACGGVVSIAPGNYLTGRLCVRAGITICGNAAWSYGAPGGSVLTLNDAHASCLLDITGAQGVRLERLCLEGKGLGSEIHGVFLSWDDYNGGGREDTPVIDRCCVSGFSGDGVHLHHVWCFTLRSSYLCRNGGAGLFVDGWDGFINDNWLSANGRCGMLGGKWCSAVTFHANRVEWNGAGGVILPAGESFCATGNFFDRNLGAGLRLGSPDGVYYCPVLGTNLFRRNGKPPHTGRFDDPLDSCHIRLIHCHNACITGNSFRYGRDDGDVGVYSPDYGIVTQGCTGAVISSNAMQECCLKACLHDEESTNETVQGNSMSLYRKIP